MRGAGAAVVAAAGIFAAPAGAIVGGALDDRDPAVVALTIGGYPYCSGALIGRRTVLTAGHCVSDLDIPIVVATGDDAARPSETFDVVESVRHPGYTGEGNENDIALLRLDHDAHVPALGLSKHVLGESDERVSLRHVGFGVAVEESGSGRGLKRAVLLPITRLTTAMVFSGADGKQTCSGDSGGPALFRDDDGVERVIGTVSDGPSCHEDGWDVRIDRVRQFIDGTVARFEKSTTTDAPSCGCRSMSPGATVAFLLFTGALRKATKPRRARKSAPRAAGE